MKNSSYKMDTCMSNNHYDLDEFFGADDNDYAHFMSMIDKPIVEISLEIALHTIYEADKIGDFRAHCGYNLEMSLWELIESFNKTKKPV